MKEKWFVYLLECQDGSLYTGTTNNIQKRMKLHKEGKGSKYVRIRGFGTLIAFKQCKDRSEACKQEYYIKQLPKENKLGWFRE